MQYEEIGGVVRRWVYQSDDRSFCVANFLRKDGGRSESFSAVGDFGDARAGEWVTMWGNFSTHPKFGKQFKVNAVIADEETGTAGIVAFLCSGEVSGIGEKTAALIGEHFGDDLERVITECPGRLTEVPGVGEKRAEEIAKAWTDKAGLRKVFTFFAQYEVPGRVARRAFKAFGPKVINMVKEDPFILLKVQGLGFKTVEAVARALGHEPWSLSYLRGAVFHMCEQVITQEGHTTVFRESLAEGVSDLVYETLRDTGVSEHRPSNYFDLMQQALDELLARGDLVEHELRDRPAVTHTRYDEAERCLGQLFADPPLSYLPKVTDITAKEALEAVRARAEIELSDEQTDAVLAALSYPRSLVTGGPGTGKTTVLNTVVQAAEYMGLTVALAAPTGKAAKRMSEVTGRLSLTVHRLLEYRPGIGFQYGALSVDGDRLHADVVIVDEASMLDATLAYAVTSAVADGAHLVLVGDFDQLPSVGPGNVLGDLLESSVVYTTWLTKVFRQGDGSGIVRAAHRVVRGDFPQEANDFAVVNLPAVGDIVDHYLAMPKQLGCGLEDIQVLIPSYRGDYGIDAFNAEVQHRLTSRNRAVKQGTSPIYVEDRVIQLRNDYTIGVVNGDVGYVTGVDSDAVYIDFDGVGTVAYPKGSVENLRPAYAVSVHKSQGSEFAGAIVVLHRSNWKLLQRSVLYTAITRAKKHCTVFSSTQTLRKAVSSNDQQLRVTMLPHWLQEFYEEVPF
jgi:exodeoxyribonuclease V alpha subunit